MSAEKKLQPNELYKLLCERHPHINAREDENLSIPDATLRIVRQCWNNFVDYPSVKKIVAVTGISERTIQLYAQKHQFPNRKIIKSKKYEKVQCY
jgi:hypothetical protein